MSLLRIRTLHLVVVSLGFAAACGSADGGDSSTPHANKATGGHEASAGHTSASGGTTVTGGHVSLTGEGGASAAGKTGTAGNATAAGHGTAGAGGSTAASGGSAPVGGSGIGGAVSSGGSGGSIAGAPDVAGAPAGGASAGGTPGAAGSPATLPTCADLAQQNGWAGGQFTCDPGDKNWCAGQGVQTSDCARCCNPSCGIIANVYSTQNASCDNGNGACNGKGIATWDCAEGCCGGGIPDGTGAGGSVSIPTGGPGFGYPVGDGSTSPAGGGGFQLWQVLGDYWSNYGGAHLAEDAGRSDAAGMNVMSVADGTVVVSSPNSSTYVNVMVTKHDMGDGTYVCAFYGHLATRIAQKGDSVKRGQVIGTILDQGTNSHLHYAMLPADLCDHITSISGAGMCGYDGSNGVAGLGHADIANEPQTYKPVGDICGMGAYTIIAPHFFIDAHHF